MAQDRENGFHKLCIRLLVRVLVIVAAVMILVHFCDLLFSILLPFLGALLLAYIVNPVIRAMQRRFGGTRKNWAIAATTFIMAAAAVALTVFVFVVYEQARLFLADWPDYLAEFLGSLQSGFAAVTDKLGLQMAAQSDFETGLQWLLSKLSEWLAGWQMPVLESAENVLVVAGNVLITVTVFVLASCYIMGDYPRFRYFVDTRLPSGLRSTISCVKHASIAAIGGYFKAQFILSAAVAVICLIVLLILRQRFAVLFAIVICIIDFIPIFGSGTILAPWAIILAMSGNYTKAFVLLVLTAALFLLRKLAEPRVLGDQTGLPTLVSLLCIYIGMRLGGVLGMILAPVLCLILINMFRAGLFRGTVRDFRLMSEKISAILNG